MPPLLIANWKMYLRRDEAMRLLAALDQVRATLSPERLWIAAPAVYLAELVASGAHLPIHFGAQDISAEEHGAFTGETSAKMVVDAGASFSLVGHSERRLYDGETNLSAAARAAAGLRAGLKVVACIGETGLHRRTGRTESIVLQQLDAYLDACRGIPGELLFAYEPIWAIGTGMTATPKDITEVFSLLSKRISSAERPACRLIYGGSVTADTVASLRLVPQLGGFLVGAASAKAESLLALLAA